MARLEKVASDVEKGVADEIEQIYLDTVSAWERTNALRLPDDADDRVRQMLRGIYDTGVPLLGMPDIDDDAKAVFPLIERKDWLSDLFDGAIRAFMAQYAAQKISLINAQTRRQIAAMLRVGQDENLGVERTAKLIREKAPELSKLRGHVIARTELHGSSQSAQLTIAKQATRPMLKVWASATDHRVRDFGEGDGVVDGYNHRAISGQSVSMEQMFEVPVREGGTERIAHPGDPIGSPGNVIMCRCAMTFRRVR